MAVKWYQGRKCYVTVVKRYQGRKCPITAVNRYQGRKCFITNRKMISRWKITMVGSCYHRNILLDMSQPHQTIRLRIILKQMARHIGPGNGKTFTWFGWPRKMAVPSPKIKWKDKGENPAPERFPTENHIHRLALKLGSKNVERFTFFLVPSDWKTIQKVRSFLVRNGTHALCDTGAFVQRSTNWANNWPIKSWSSKPTI